MRKKFKMINRGLVFAALFVFMMLGSATKAQSIIYVNQAATGANNGSSWTNAYNNLQDGIDAALAGDQVWVAAGSYLPTKDNNGVPSAGGRTGTFSFRTNIEIYGGFNGTETAVSQRICGPATATILSGDLGVAGIASDNALHVCYSEGLSSAFLMDCFIIRDGYGLNGFSQVNGVGWLNSNVAGPSSPSISNVQFINNRRGGQGGAFYNEGFNSIAQPSFSNCSFSLNEAEVGGAIYNNGMNGNASPTLVFCNFVQNESGDGGAIYNNGENGIANGTCTDCVFSQNQALFGGAISNYAYGGETRGNYLRCMFDGNVANESGGAIASYGFNGDAKTTFSDCDFQFNQANIHGGAAWNNSASPRFEDSRFMQNSSAQNGGAMYNDGGQTGNSSPTVLRCDFDQNVALLSGGAMYNNGIAGQAEAQVIFCKFRQNQAANGGACYHDGSVGDAEPLYYNCIFSRNAASQSGGAHYMVANSGNCTPYLAGCSFYANTAPNGSFIYGEQLNGGNANAICFNLASYGHAGNIASFSGGAMMQTEHGLYETSLPIACSGTCLPGQNPMYTAPNSDDLTLQPGSPAIDQGNNIWVHPNYSTDLAGNNRIQGPFIDLGAYENSNVPPCPRVIYVNKIATGANTGFNWPDAFLDLQDALAYARANACVDTILVAEGTYFPHLSNTSISFEIVNDVEMYGGFPNTGSPWFQQRDLVLHETILSGDLGVQGNFGDNSSVVLSAGNLAPAYGAVNYNSGTLVDGFSIVGGRTAFGEYMSGQGTFEAVFRQLNIYNNNNNAGSSPGIHLSRSNNALSVVRPLFEDCQLHDNVGLLTGAVDIWPFGPAAPGLFNPMFRRCVFERNTSSQLGGAVMIKGDCYPHFEHCTFGNNFCSGSGTSGINLGGGVINATANTSTTQTTTFDNCLFYRNSATNNGGVAYYNVSTGERIRSHFNNCTFVGNTALNGGVIASYCNGDFLVKMNNCVEWNNDATYVPVAPWFWSPGDIAWLRGSPFSPMNRLEMTNCLIDAPACSGSPDFYTFSATSTVACFGTMIYGQNPQFVNAAADNYRLALSSPAINAGNNALVPSGITTDLAGNVRIDNGIVDMGCYENFPGMMRPAVFISSTTPTHYQGYSSTALLESNAYGGFPPYTYAWSTGETTANIAVNPSQSSTYSLTVTDAIGDTASASYSVTVVNVACTLNNGQQGVEICLHNGQTKCLPLAAAQALVNNGNASLGACGSMKQGIAAELTAAKIKLFPNPALAVLNIELEGLEAQKIQVLDQIGRIVMDLESETRQINIQDLPAGMYFLRVIGANGQESQRFLKQ